MIQAVSYTHLKYYNDFDGIVNNLERRFRETNSQWMKDEIAGFMNGVECPDCHGDRLKPTVWGLALIHISGQRRPHAAQKRRAHPRAVR